MVDGYNSTFKGQKIIHYTSGKKAWNNPGYDLAYYFWEYARRTTFYEEILYINILSKQNVSKITDEVINKINNQNANKNKKMGVLQRIKKKMRRKK